MTDRATNDLEAIRRNFHPGRGERAARSNVVLDLCDEVEQLRAQLAAERAEPRLPGTAWIQQALPGGDGREVVVRYRPGDGYEAALEFTDLDQRITATGATPCAALLALDCALQEDAAEEMRRAGGA